MARIIELNEGRVVVYSPKYNIYFSRPLVGIEEDMSPPKVIRRIRNKFNKWRQSC